MASTAPQPEPPQQASRIVGRRWWCIAILAALLPWLSQPPLGWWPIAFIAAIPILLASTEPAPHRKQMLVLYATVAAYWALTLQGLRHAHPAMYLCWLALAGYLAVYPVLFVVALGRILRQGIPMIVAAPILWVGMECLRNYLLTGISAVMLGHTMADVPIMIQIADLGGSYAVSFVLVACNVALLTAWQAVMSRRRSSSAEPLPHPMPHPVLSVTVAAILLSATLLYGRFRLQQPTDPSTTTLALIGRNERVEYGQDPSRELELFDAYTRQSIEAVRNSDVSIDAVVWPESMFTGTLPWMIGGKNAELARQQGLRPQEFEALVQERRDAFRQRAAAVQAMLQPSRPADPPLPAPDLVVGCGVVDYSDAPRVYSGIVHIGKRGEVQQWYGKTHLVMFGEYVPLIPHLPLVRNWVPDGLGVTPGPGPQAFDIGNLKVSPNICIETAVERVAINHLRRLGATTSIPDAIVTVTNDGWFDDSSIITHHQRCAQLVAVACRRPILSAANNGPTAWIDSCGRVIEALPQGAAGSVIASPRLDRRTSLVMVLGDWPARFCAVLFVGPLLYRRRKSART
ncbi:apolipoprotein N-acyltransferase [Roseiconus nitratireducens]|nr:apolipoprotein N-acyltransferase [Roseiconus nitratireducens]